MPNLYLEETPMNEVLIKIMRRVNIFSVFLTGLALAFLLGISLWCYSLLKTIYMFDELAGQTYNNKEAILSQTASSKTMENLSQPGEIDVPLSPSEKVEKALLSVDTVAEVEVNPITYNKKISQQTSSSRDQHQPDPERADGKEELQIEATAKRNLNSSAENSITAKCQLSRVMHQKTIKGIELQNFTSR